MYFKPAPDYHYPTVFKYVVVDNEGATNSAYGIIDITPVNDAPVAYDVSATGLEDASFIAIRLSGSDIDSEFNGFKLLSLPDHGQLYSDVSGSPLTSADLANLLSASGGSKTLYFKPAANFNGDASFNYTAVDNEGANDASPATATVHVTSVNDVPIANDVSATGDEDASFIAITLTGSDIDGTVNGFKLLSLPEHGQLYSDVSGSPLTSADLANLISANGANSKTLYFKPAANFNGDVSFQYNAVDNNGASSAASATATVHVNPVNDAPTITSAVATGEVSAGSPLNSVAASYLVANHDLVDNLGGTAGFGENVLSRNDDGSTSAIDIRSVFGNDGIDFFGQHYTSFYINNNGNITFANSSGTFTPSQIAGGAGNPIIAAFWADVDTRGGAVGATAGGHSTGSNLVYYDLDPVNGVVTITWDDVGFYSSNTSKLNAFQIQLIDRGDGDFDIVYRYEDINWTTGSASGGTDGLGGTPARAGYSAGDGNPDHYFELPGSGNQDSMLALESTTGNTGIAGVYVFHVRSGNVESPVTGGSIEFQDVDATDTHTVSSSYNAAASSFVNPLGTLHVTLAQDSNAGGTGVVDWQYDVNPALLRALSPWTVVTETFDVTISDGHGGTVTQSVTVTVNGPQDDNTVRVVVNTDQGFDMSSITTPLLLADELEADQNHIRLYYAGSAQTTTDDLIFQITGENLTFSSQSGENRLIGGTITGMTVLHLVNGVPVPLATYTGFHISGIEIQHAIDIYDDTGNTDAFRAIFASYNYSIDGNDGADILAGGVTNDVMTGRLGNDILIGLDGNDRAVYRGAAGPVTVLLAAGSVTGDGIGTDTLQSVENITGSRFDDIYDARGFSGSSQNAGSLGTTNSFDGLGGDDTIYGNGSTIISFNLARAGVAVDLRDGTADGDSSVGHDHFTGVIGVRGSQFDDTLYGSDATAYVEVFLGEAGNDFIDGRGGLDRVNYASILSDIVTGGINVNMRDGIVTGDSSVGTDTLRSIEFVRGTRFADVYDATGFGQAGALNVGSNGAFNEFEVTGGNDTIIGNGFTRLAFYNASAGVTVDIAAGSAVGTAFGNSFKIGVEGNTAFTGVNYVSGSQYDDTIYGSNNPSGTSELFDGRAGNDFIDGRGGYDIAAYNTDTSVSAGIHVSLAAGQVTGPAEIGTDTLRSIEGIRGTNFDDVFDARGFNANSVNAGSVGNGGFNTFDGFGGDDTIYAGAGNGSYTGGAGHDTFVFTPANSRAVITDMTLGNLQTNANADIIELDGFGYTDVSQLTIIDNGSGDARIDLGNGHFIDLTGVAYTTQFTNANFHFGAILVA